jgi:hypothetical protein
MLTFDAEEHSFELFLYDVMRDSSLIAIKSWGESHMT